MNHHSLFLDRMIPIAATFSGGPMVAETLQDLNASLCASKDPDGNKDILQELEAHANTSRLFDEVRAISSSLTAVYNVYFYIRWALYRDSSE